MTGFSDCARVGSSIDFSFVQLHDEGSFVLCEVQFQGQFSVTWIQSPRFCWIVNFNGKVFVKLLSVFVGFTFAGSVEEETKGVAGSFDGKRKKNFQLICHAKERQAENSVNLSVICPIFRDVAVENLVDDLLEDSRKPSPREPLHLTLPSADGSHGEGW